MSEFNKRQLEAIECQDKYIRVVAGAGSGKTTVLTSRMISLINKNVSPYKILAITFTNKAANEMKDRVIKKIGNKDGYPYVTTFHSFCARFLREEYNSIDYKKDFTIIDDKDQEKILKDILKEKNVEKTYIDHKSMMGFISYIKTYHYYSKYAPYDELSKEKLEIFKIYDDKLKFMNALDFDDLLLKTYKVLQKDNKILYKWQQRYSHILVDEFQDTNDIQFEIIKFLVGKENNLFVVGDPDQTIYTWRGANLHIIMSFEDVFPSTKTIILDKNYRSTKDILEKANTLIKHNKNRIHKDLITDNKTGEKVTYDAFERQSDESLFVAATTLKHINNDQLTYKDIAVLYRANHLSRSVEESLMRMNIPYQIFGGVKFYDRKEIKDALAHLKLLLNKNDDLSFLRIINEPTRGVGELTIDKMNKIAKKENISLYETFKNNLDILNREQTRRKISNFFEVIEKYTEYVDKMSLSELLGNLLEEIGYINALALLEKEESEERINNINELKNNLLYFENESEDVSLATYLQEISLYAAQDYIKDGEYVSLMTIHTAKGLEYPCVFVVGLNDGVFPSSRSMFESGGLEEERRLAYVAITRAKKYLHLSSTSDFNFQTSGRYIPSRFISEIFNHDALIFKSETVAKPIKKENAVITPIKNDITWSLGDKVNHVNFGFGIVIGINDKLIKIAFKDPLVGTKTLLGNHGSLSKG